MRGLTPAERRVLELCGQALDLEIRDDECDVADELVARGLLATWVDADGTHWWELNASGRRALRVCTTTGATV